MKTLACLMLLAVGAIGCATTEVATPASLSPQLAPQSPASAMVFTPRPAMYSEPVDLGRSGRDIVAYGGFEQFSLSTTFVRQDDDQRSDFTSSTGWQSRFSRRAISTTVRSVSR
jgi:hypothetical protein